jgi:hypothetical protein
MKLFFLLLTLTRPDGVEMLYAVDTGLSFEDCIARTIETHDRLRPVLGDDYLLSCEEDGHISQ